jgi:DNA-binding transcriptional regulator YiaG
VKEKHLIKDLRYNGFGFPIIVHNAPAKMVRGKLEATLNYKELGADVILALCLKPTPLTGAQVKFVRLYFDLSLRDFSDIFGLTHPAILKWESYEDHFANILPAIEKTLRLEALYRLGLKPVDFHKRFGELKKIASTIKSSITSKETPLKIAM